MIETDTFLGEIGNGSSILTTGAPFSLESTCSLTFYSDEYITPVAPTGGTVLVTASDDGFNYGSVSNGTIEFPTDAYGRPNFYGYVTHVKAKLTDITGATHFRLRVHNLKNK